MSRRRPRGRVLRGDPPKAWAPEPMLRLLGQGEGARLRRSVRIGRVGMGGVVPVRTLGEVGASIGVTRERVRQIELEAVAKLARGLLGVDLERHRRRIEAGDTSAVGAADRLDRDSLAAWAVREFSDGFSDEEGGHG